MSHSEADVVGEGHWKSGQLGLVGGALHMVAADAGVTRKRRRGLPESDTRCCSACGVRVLGARQCWGCGLWLCPGCVEANGSSPVGALNCLDCMAEAYTEGAWDFTADQDLLLYLATRELPPGCSPAKAKRLVAAGEHLFWDGCRLWYSVGDWEREVPPRWRRKLLVETVQASLGYPGGRRLY